MFNWLKKQSGTQAVLGIDTFDDGYALAVVEPGVDGEVTVTGARWCALGDPSESANRLKRAVKAVGASGLPVVATLQLSAYTLVQLEAPKLDDDEMREAMRWRVKDLVDFPIEQAIIDVFKLPASRRPGAPELVYVVVAKQQEVELLGSILREAGLRVQAIDIAEMAIRNLALHVDKPERPRAYLHLLPSQTIIEIADGPQIYLSRRILQEFDADAEPGLLQAQMENLALEVQRSLDYFESQYALGPADSLSVICFDVALAEAFINIAGTFLTVPTERFRFAAMKIASGVELGNLGRGITAVGTAFRGLRWAA